MANTQRKRTRLDPEARREQILDATAALVLREGLARLTMADVAAAAAVSKSLIYAYFTNLTELLEAVYARETKLLNEQHFAALRTPHSFEDMVRATARISRQAQNERQRLVERLAAEPTLKDRLAEAEKKNRRGVVRFLTREITNHYQIPRPLAEAATRLALRFEPERESTATEAAKLDEIWGAMIVGAMNELERRYGTAAVGQATGKTTGREKTP
ncbi:MAG: TetR/AcrR family transcriptional regulator [Pseudomonadota bacterium]